MDTNTWLVLGTFFVGLVALSVTIWGDWLSSIFFHPKLKIYFDQGSADVTKIPTTVTVAVPFDSETRIKSIRDVGAYYVRFRVKNEGISLPRTQRFLLKALKKCRQMVASCPEKDLFLLI